jgi:CxxC-x17-CxxC domain-containing protein
LYSIPSTEVEAAIDKWSSTVPSLQTPDGEEAGAGKFRVECWGDKKQIYVPFEPIEGRPIYCKDCMIKIKNGELTPAPGFKLPRDKNAPPPMSYDALANLGIEFTPEKKTPKSHSPRVESRSPGKPSFTQRDVKPHFKKDSFGEHTNSEPVQSLGDIIKNTIKPLVGLSKKEETVPSKKSEPVSETISLKDLVKPKTVVKPDLATDQKSIKKESSDQLKNIIAQAMNLSKKDTVSSTQASLPLKITQDEALLSNSMPNHFVSLHQSPQLRRQAEADTRPRPDASSGTRSSWQPPVHRRS